MSQPNQLKPPLWQSWILWMTIACIVLVVAVIGWYLLLRTLATQDQVSRQVSQTVQEVRSGRADADADGGWPEDASLAAYDLPAAGGDQGRRVKLAGGTLSIIPPAGWNTLTPPTPQYLAYYEGPLRDKNAPTIALMKAADKYPTYRAGLEATLKRLAEMDKDVSADSQAQTAVNGHEAFVLRATLPSADLKVMTIGVRDADGSVYVLELTSRSAAFTQNLTIFEAAAASFRLK